MRTPRVLILLLALSGGCVSARRYEDLRAGCDRLRVACDDMRGDCFEKPDEEKLIIRSDEPTEALP